MVVRGILWCHSGCPTGGWMRLRRCRGSMELPSSPEHRSHVRWQKRTGTSHMCTAGLAVLTTHPWEAQSIQVCLETFSVWCKLHATMLRRDHLLVLNHKLQAKDQPAVFHIWSGSQLSVLTPRHPIPLQPIPDLTSWNTFLQCHDPTFLRIQAGLS